jgi:hypothetical protein
VFDQTDRRLKEWVRAVLGDTAVSLDQPRDTSAESGVGLYLLEVIAAPAARGATRPPLRLELRYLVTTWAEEPEEAHRLLGTLLVAALEGSDFEVDLEPLPAATWAAFGAAPRPSFRLRVPFRHARPEPVTRIVRVPLDGQAPHTPPTLHWEPLLSLYGLVLGTLGGPAGGDEIPLMGARVELPALRRAVHTDPQGRFHFQGVPSQTPPTLRITAKGQEVLVKAEQPTSEREPLVIRFTFVEG